MSTKTTIYPLPLLKTVTGYAAHARLLAELDQDDELTGLPDYVRDIPRQEIPSPYAYSATHNVYRHKGREVIIVETEHRKYRMFDASGVASE